MEVTREHLLLLANACLLELHLDHDYGMGIAMDGKRPFGNSGHAGLIDTLEVVGIHAKEEHTEDDYEYARSLWLSLPAFIRGCILVEKAP